MKKDHTTHPAARLRLSGNWRSRLLLLLLCVTIVWPASLQSLFQSLAPDAFLAIHATSMGDSHAVEKHGWMPDPSDNQSALTQTSLTVSGSAVRPTDPNTRRASNDSASGPDIQATSFSPDAPDSVPHFFAYAPLTPLASDVPPSPRLQATAKAPQALPAHLPSHRGLVRFALAPPTFC